MYIYWAISLKEVEAGKEASGNCANVIALAASAESLSCTGRKVVSS